MIFELDTKLKRLREDRKLKQSDVATLLGIKPATVSLYENGTCKPTTDILVKMAILFGTTTDYLLGIDKKKSIAVDELLPLEREMLHDFNSAIIDYLRKEKIDSVK